MDVGWKAEQNIQVNQCFSKASPWYFQPAQPLTGWIAQTDSPGSCLFWPSPWCSQWLLGRMSHYCSALLLQLKIYPAKLKSVSSLTAWAILSWGKCIPTSSAPRKHVGATACCSSMGKSFSNPEEIVGDPCQK